MYSFDGLTFATSIVPIHLSASLIRAEGIARASLGRQNTTHCGDKRIVYHGYYTVLSRTYHGFGIFRKR